MTDYFALLGQLRRPWLDDGALKQRFLSQSAATHPDKIDPANEPEKQAASKKFADLNAGYHCLLLPKLRLLHLIELERGSRPAEVREIPSPLADLFAQVASLCREADGFLAKKTKTASPMLQAQLFEEAQAWIEQLNRMQKELTAFHDELLARLKSLDARWPGDGANRPELLNDLENLYRLFSYFNRWHGQVRERIIRLSI